MNIRKLKKLSDNLFETICSMLNRNGGHIFLGVKDNSEVIGVYKDYIKKMKNEFVDLCNNTEKNISKRKKCIDILNIFSV